MRIVHKFGTGGAAKLIDFMEWLGAVGIKYEYDQTIVSNFLYFTVAEDHPRWDEVARLAASHDIPSTQINAFTKKELDESIEKILKGADRAKKSYDVNKEPTEELYR